MPLSGSMVATDRATSGSQPSFALRRDVYRGPRKASRQARGRLTSFEQGRRRRFACRASDTPSIGAEGEPQFSVLDVESEGGLGGTSEKVFGPRAILLIGCAPPEIEFFESVAEYSAEHLEAFSLVVANKKILEGKLSEAFLVDSAEAEAPPLGLRRVVIFSGMDAREVLELIELYVDSGLARAVFAAAVPNNWDHNVAELVEEVCSDDQMMQQRQQQEQQSAAQEE